MKINKKALLLVMVITLSVGILAAGYVVRAGTACPDIGCSGDPNMIWWTASTNDPSPSCIDSGGKVYPANPSEGTIDQGLDKNVGSADIICKTQDAVSVVFKNAYPGYISTITTTIKNIGCKPLKIASVNISGPLGASGQYTPLPDALSIADISPQTLTGYTLAGGATVSGIFTVSVNQSALQSSTYYFVIRLNAEGSTSTQGKEGSVGFWKNWEANKTYNECQIEAWLLKIDRNLRDTHWKLSELRGSDWWNGPDTIDRMTACLAKANGGTMQQKFLAQYLAQRLNLASKRQNWNTTHNITVISGYSYLVKTGTTKYITDPTHANAKEIMNSIESKYGTYPTDAQFEVMKNICEALNTLTLP